MIPRDVLSDAAAPVPGATGLATYRLGRDAPDAWDGPSAMPGAHAVLHVAGRVTDSVFAFIGPATEALALRGVRQALVMLDDPRFEHLVRRLHPSIDLYRVAPSMLFGGRWRGLRTAFQAALFAHRPSMVHLHGTVPALVVRPLLRRCFPTVQVYFSAHGSDALGRWGVVGRPLLRGLCAGWPRSSIQAIAHTPSELSLLADVAPQSVGLVEAAIDDTFFDIRRREDAEPLLLGGGSFGDRAGSDTFVQLAVLLDASGSSQFRWTTLAPRTSAAALRAAQVAHPETTDDRERAALLARAWMFVAPGRSHGFPRYLAEAMAAGLPCVVADCPGHRDLVDDGVNGFVCAGIDAFLQRIEQLQQSQVLRRSLGAAARATALRRLTAHRLQYQVVGVYDAPPSAASRERSHGGRPQQAVAERPLHSLKEHHR